MFIALLGSDETKNNLLVIVFFKDELEDMKAFNPLSLDAQKLGGDLPPLMYLDLSVMVAYEEDEEEFRVVMKKLDSREMTDYLQRGKKGAVSYKVIDYLHNPDGSSKVQDS